MGPVLHGRARTTAAVRRAIQHRPESRQGLATRYSIHPKTVAKWRKRPTTADARMGPAPASTVLTPEQQAIALAFRRHTLLALDDCLQARQATIPRLSRPALHRCFQRHGIRRLPLNEDGQSPPKKKFKDCPIGCLHVDFAEVQTEEGKQYLFVALDRTSKVAFAELHPRAKRGVAAGFLRRGLDKLPYKVPTVLTDNGVQFTPQPHQFLPGGHRFDRICREYGVEPRLTTPAHPWTKGQVERMNRTLKEAPVKRCHYQSTQELNEHLQACLLAYNHARRLKTLRGLTPHEFLCAQRQKNPTIFTQDPTHLTLGLYS
ncbi:IS481 family transposase [Hymenobacter terricola]|uniref:IS481 family transposase n=1 Tax=Hymenobacter terricola TaxID=2819236 RepID=UPI001CF582FC|nr:IS481 family transposase [Hymenobacter terricola]